MINYFASGFGVNQETYIYVEMMYNCNKVLVYNLDDITGLEIEFILIFQPRETVNDYEREEQVLTFCFIIFYYNFSKFFSNRSFTVAFEP